MFSARFSAMPDAAYGVSAIRFFNVYAAGVAAACGELRGTAAIFVCYYFAANH
jgi:hypothetical protein